MAMQAGSSAAQYTPHVVGGAFVKQYYETLHNSPKDAHKFYYDSSILGRVDSDGNMTSVTTINDINVELLSTDFTGCMIELETVDSQASHGGGVLTLVTGSFTDPNSVKQKFTQSFFLAPQVNGGYFVLNDMFRFVSARPSTEINEVIANHDNENSQIATLSTDPASVDEGTVLDLPSAEKILLNDEVTSPPANGVSPVKTDASVEMRVKAVNKHVGKIPEAAPASAENVEKIPEAASASAPASAENPKKKPEAAPTLASSEKDVPKKTYASIVKDMRESTPPAPAAKPKPRPKAAQNTEKTASSPSKPAHVTNTATPGDKIISKNKSHDEPGYSVFVKNLPYNATVEMVEQEFRKFGAIKPRGIQVRNHQPDRFCFGFVEFESQHSMEAAIEASPVCFGSRESYVEAKRTMTRVVNGVITRGDENGNAGGSRFPPGRGGYQGDNFRGQGAGFVNNGYYHDGADTRNNFRNQNEYSGRCRAPQGNGYPPSGNSYHQNGNSYHQNGNNYHQNRNGYHQNGNRYTQNGNGPQQRRPSQNGSGTDGHRQTPPAA